MKTILSYGIGESPTTESDSDAGGYGELFHINTGSNVISLYSSSLIETSKLVYYGVYTVEIQGGVGFGSTIPSFNSASLICTITIVNVCIAQDFVSFNDPTTLLQNDDATQYYGTSYDNDFSVVGYPFVLHVNDAAITYAENLCGPLVLAMTSD